MYKKRLEKLSDDVSAVSLLLEVVKDACIANDYYNLNYVLEIALEKQQKISEEIETMY